MKIRELAFLAVRILGIYLFVLGLKQLVDLLQLTGSTYLQWLEHEVTFMEVFLFIGLPSLILLIGGIVLWIFAKPISKSLILKDSTESESHWQMREIEGFVLSVVGLLLVVWSLPTMTRMIVNYINIAGQEVRFDKMSYIYPIIEQGIRFLIGLLLLLKAEGFALILRKIRNKGSKPQD